jgi:hypothetical protein
MTTPRPHNSKRSRPAHKGNKHQAKRRIEAQMFAKSRQSFTESESRNYLRAEHTAQGA